MKNQEEAFESFSEKMKQAEKEMQVFANSASLLNCGGSIADVAELQHRQIMDGFHEKLEINVCNK